MLLRNIKLRFSPNHFEGLLLDEEEHPVIGAKLYFGDVESTSTALSGKFVVSLKSGAYPVSVLYKEIRLERVDVVIINGRTERLEPIKISRDRFQQWRKTPEPSVDLQSSLSESLHKSEPLTQEAESAKSVELSDLHAPESSSEADAELLSSPLAPLTSSLPPLTSLPERPPKTAHQPQVTVIPQETTELSTLTRFIEALRCYNNHEEELPDDFEDRYGAACQEMSDLTHQHLNQRGLKTRRLKRSRLNQLFGFKKTFPIPKSDIMDTLGVDSAFVALFAVPLLWQLTPKGEQLLADLILPEGSVERDARIDRRRGFFVFLAYRLPTRRSKNGYKGDDFQAALRAHVAELKLKQLGQPCLFNLGQRAHIGVIVHETSYVALQENPRYEYDLSLERFEEAYHLMNQ